MDLKTPQSLKVDHEELRRELAKATDENKTIVRRFFELGPSSGDMNAANALLSPNFALHTPLPSAPGIQGINDVVKTCRAAFEHLNVTVEDMVAEGNKVVARFTARGTHKGQFMGLPPTGKPITMTGTYIGDNRYYGEKELEEKGIVKTNI